MAEHEPLQFAVFREQADAGRDGVAGRTDVESTSVKDDVACVSLVSPKDQPQRLRAARAHETGNRQDLPCPHRERDVADGFAPAEAADGKSHGAGSGRASWIFVGQLAADHHLDQFGPAESLKWPRADVPTVTEHDHSVSQGKNLVESVADVDDRDATRLEVANDLEEPAHFARRQGGGGLVHDDDPRVAGQGPGDLDELLLRGGEPRTGSVEVDRHAELAEEIRCPTAFLAACHEARPRRLLPKEDVFSGREFWNQIELLVDHGDAGRAGLLRRAKRDFHTVHLEHAGIGAMGSPENLHERALPRAVLAQQREHLAGMHVEIHPTQSLHAGKRLPDPLHNEQWRS